MKKIILFPLFVIFMTGLFAQTVTIDSTFGQNGMIVLQKDYEPSFLEFDKLGNIITVGKNYFYQIILTKTTKDGILDPNFGTNGIISFNEYEKISIMGLKITPENKIFLIGQINERMANAKIVLMQLNQDGSYDENFGENGKIEFGTLGRFYFAESVNIENDDFILLRVIDHDYSPSYNYIFKCNYRGEIDENFGVNGKLLFNFFTKPHTITSQSIKMLKDGAFLVSGRLSIQDKRYIVCFKFNINGNLVTDFAEDGVWKMQLPTNNSLSNETLGNFIEDSYGNLVFTGKYKCGDFEPIACFFLCGLLANGTLNNDFGNQGYYLPYNKTDWGSWVTQIPQLVQNGNKFIVGFVRRIMSFNPNGTLNLSFNNTGEFVFDNFACSVMKLQTSNTLIVGGKYRVNFFEDYFSIIRLNIPSNNSINENSLCAPMVFPNPTTGELRVTSYELQVTSIEVFDIYGRAVSTHYSLLTTHYSINIAHLPAGLYFVKVITETGIQTKKVIKL